MSDRRPPIHLPASLFWKSTKDFGALSFVALFVSVLTRRVYCLSRSVVLEINFAHHSPPFIVFPLTALLKSSVAAVACKLCRQWLVVSVLFSFYKRSRSRWRLSAFPGPYDCPYDKTQLPPEGISLNFILRTVKKIFRLIPVNKIGHFTWRSAYICNISLNSSWGWNMLYQVYSYAFRLFCFRKPCLFWDNHREYGTAMESKETVNDWNIKFPNGCDLHAG